jgi:hypothetical protein
MRSAELRNPFYAERAGPRRLLQLEIKRRQSAGTDHVKQASPIGSHILIEMRQSGRDVEKLASHEQNVVCPASEPEFPLHNIERFRAGLMKIKRRTGTRWDQMLNNVRPDAGILRSGQVGDLDSANPETPFRGRATTALD